MKDLGYSISEFEDAALEILAPMKTAGTVRTLDTYAGQLAVDDIAQVTRLWPAIYVLWGGTHLDALGTADGLRCGITFLVCDRNLRGHAAAKRGDNVSTGVYALLDQLRSRVHGKLDLPGWYRARLRSERPLAYDPVQGVAVYEALYELRKQT